MADEIIKKYELTDETKEVYGRTLYRIKALVDIPRAGIRAGDLGGWVGSEYNLDHEGDCWIGSGAHVYVNVRVHGDAQICGDIQIYGDARIHGGRIYG